VRKDQNAQLIIWSVALAIVSGVVIYIIKPRRNDQSERDIFEKLDEAFSKLDEQRLKGLQALKELQNIKQSMLQQEVERLTQKYGKEHPRVLKLQKQIEYNKSLLSHLEDSAEIANIQVPKVDDECCE
jgi:hypothetical protein